MFGGGHNNDKIRQDIELGSMGLSRAKDGRWQEVGAVTIVVFIVGMLLTYSLDLSPLLWKISGFVFFVIGLGLGLVLRNSLLKRQAERLAESKKNAAHAREQETQRQLAEMRRKNEDV